MLKPNKKLLIAITITALTTIILSACENNNPVYETITIYPIPNSNYTIIEKNYPEIEGSVRYGLGDADGNPISEIKYGDGTFKRQAIYHYGGGIFKVMVMENSIYKYGLMDSTGKELTELKFGYMEERISNEGYVAAFVGADNYPYFTHYDWFGNGKWGYLNRTGEAIEIKYDAIACFSIRDANGFPMDKGSFFASGLTFVYLGDKCGCIDTTGKIVIPFLYDYVSSFTYEELAIVALDGKYGYIDITGKVVIPIIYDSAKPFWNNDGTAWVKLNGENFKINKQGERI